MGLADFIVLAAAAGIIIVSCAGYIKGRKNKSCGSCAGCPMHGKCASKNKQN